MTKLGMINHDQIPIEFSKFEDLPFMFDKIVSTDLKSQILGLRCLRKLISQGNSLVVQRVIDSNLISKFIDFLKKDDFPLLQMESARVFTSMALQGTKEHVQTIVDFGAILHLLKLLNSNNFKVLGAVNFFLTYLYQHCLYITRLFAL